MLESWNGALKNDDNDKYNHLYFSLQKYLADTNSLLSLILSTLNTTLNSSSQEF